jgi:uroporphyrinogen decarboxylase
MTLGSDRFLRACRREAVDATPVWFMRQAGRALPEFRAIRARASLPQIVADPSLAAEVTLLPVERLGVDAAIVFADLTTPLPGLGVPVEFVEGVGPVIDHPIRASQDLDRLRAFEPAAAVGPTLETLRLVREVSPVPVLGFSGAPFTIACYLVEGRPSRDLAVIRRMAHAQPGLLAGLLDVLGAMVAAYLRAQVAAGAQAVQLFDSWVGALSPYDYGRLVRPVMDRLLGELAGTGVPIIHFGTGCAGLLESMAEAGGDVIGLDWRVELGEAWRRVGPRRAIQGNLDPVALFGSWPDIAAQTDAILAAADGRSGHIFNLGHGVLPDTPPETLRRLAAHVHESTAASRTEVA